MEAIVEMMRWLDSIPDSMEMNVSKLQETVKDREAWHAASMGSQRVGHDVAPEQLQQLLPVGKSSLRCHLYRTLQCPRHSHNLCLCV